MTQATLSPVRVPTNSVQQEHSPRQLAAWLADRKPSICRKAEPAFQALWDAGEFFALEDLLRDVRAIMLEITPGPRVRTKVRSQLNRMMQRVTGAKHHGFEECLRDERPKKAIPFVPPKPTSDDILDSEPTPSNRQQPEYLPTLEEIRKACKAIRAGWSDEERLRRRRLMPGELTGPKSEKRTCQVCGESFISTRRLRCETCHRQHQLRYHRDKQRTRRATGKAVAR